MEVTRLDVVIAIVSIVICFAPALFFARRSGKGTAEFFASGQAAPWWLVGTSMVATTFSTDTPNLVTDFVRSHGVSYNWAWWSFLLTGMATMPFYAMVCGSSGGLSEPLACEWRRSGRPAAVVRSSRSVVRGS